MIIYLLKTIKAIIDKKNIKVIKLKDLNVVEKIGEGGQAKVYRGKYENDKVAVKIISEFDLKCLSNEIEILSQISHENIPVFYGMVFEDKNVGLVIQLIIGKPLDEINYKDIKEKDKVRFMKSLCSSLTYIHSLNYIHRDLKPENILIEDKTMKLYLIDFGIAKVITDLNSTITRAKGTMHYPAPEIFDVNKISEKQEIISVVSTKVDVWSFGCILSYLFSGFLPWCNKYKDQAAIIQKVLTKKTTFPIPENITDQKLQDIIALCVQIDVSKRTNMEDLKIIIDKY